VLRKLRIVGATLLASVFVLGVVDAQIRHTPSGCTDYVVGGPDIRPECETESAATVRTVAEFTAANAEQLTAADADNLSFCAGQDCTVLAWFRHKSDTGIDQFIFAKGNGFEYAAKADHSSSNFQPSLGAGAGGTCTGAAIAVDVAQTTTWHLGGVIYDHADTSYQGYLDDVTATDASCEANANQALDLWIGASDAAGNNLLDGYVGPIYAYTRKLTAGELTILNAGTGTQGLGCSELTGSLLTDLALCVPLQEVSGDRTASALGSVGAITFSDINTVTSALWTVP